MPHHTPRKRSAPAVPTLDDKTRKWLNEVLRDTIKSNLATAWEQEFAVDLHQRLSQNRLRELTDKQREIVERIEARIYVT